MKRYKFFLDFAKEEKWLNQMAEKGYQLVAKDAFGGYRFRTGEAKETVIRMDYRLFKNEADFQDYRLLFEDSGWKHIAGTKNSGAQYFARCSSRAGEHIFSDAVSSAGRYKRLSTMWMSLSMAFLPILFALASTDVIDIKALMNPKLLFYTPGLWEKTALDFWKAFLFEMPFAVARGLAWLVVPVTIILYLYFAFKSHGLYRQSLKQE